MEKTYALAYADAEEHRDENPKNEMHEIKIIERRYSESTITLFLSLLDDL